VAVIVNTDYNTIIKIIIITTINMTIINIKNLVTAWSRKRSYDYTQSTVHGSPSNQLLRLVAKLAADYSG